jgi:hypothetical protein
MLFGHQDDANQPSAPVASSVDAPQDSTSTGMNPLAVDTATGVSLPVAPASDTAPSSGASLDEPSVLDQPSASVYGSQPVFAGDPAPTTPFGSDQAATPVDASTVQPDPVPAVIAPSIEPTPGGEPVTVPAPVQSFSDYSASTAATAPDNDLLGLKQRALSQLGPLVSHLDQTPEEKFRTTMMLIQTTDNSALLKNAYEAAQSITDEKTRAQALLDVVNEINYFTQQQSAADNSNK